MERPFEIVRRGMELLQWEYTTEEWQAAVRAEAQDVGKTLKADAKPILVAALMTGAIAGLFFSPVIGVITGVIIAALPFAHASSRKNMLINKRDTPPSEPVLFTSTGLIWDGTGYLWHDPPNSLRHVELRDEPSLRLVLRFSGEVQIPVPPRAEKDIRELLVLLEAKTGKKRTANG